MNICFIGGGNMANAMIGGLVGKDWSREQISVVEISAENRAKLQQTFGVKTTERMSEGVKDSNVIVLAVKPQQLREVATQLAPLLSEQLLISIAAGIRAADLAHWLGSENVVRAMPNTPALIRSGMTGLYALPAVSASDQNLAGAILSSVGNILWLENEAKLDAVTAISGSGPAYVFYFIEAMQQAAQELGLSAEDARQLSIETFLGASKLASPHERSYVDVSVLRERVTSKNGTTERALLSMEANHVKQHIITAAKAAATRSREMGDELGNAS